MPQSSERRKRRSIELIALLLAPSAASHAARGAIHRSVGGGLSGLASSLVKTLVPAAVGGALVLVYISNNAQRPPACCEATQAILDDQSRRLKELANSIVRVQFENSARDEQLAELAAVPAQPVAPAKRQRTQSRASTLPTTPITAPTQPASSPERVEPPLSLAPSCDWVDCHLAGYPGECCQAIRATLKQEPSGIAGVNRVVPR